MTSNKVTDTAQTPTPNPDLKSLDIMIGTWKVIGGAEGTLRFEWMEGGFFLIQHVELVQNGRMIKGTEFIGHLRSFGERPSKEIKSRYYDTMGNTFDYVYELSDGSKTLTIYAGEKGSSAYYVGKFSDDGNTMAGEWHYTDGGGYKVVGTRIK
jgi:hypothetical protein